MKYPASLYFVQSNAALSSVMTWPEIDVGCIVTTTVLFTSRVAMMLYTVPSMRVLPPPLGN